MAREVTGREASAEAVASAAETHAAEVAKAFVAKFKQHVPKKEEVPDVGVLLRTLAKALRTQSADLLEKSAQHDAELADDAAPREARDTATTELVQAMVTIRSACEVAYGRVGLKALGIDGRTPTDAKAIQEHAGKFVAQLKSPKVKLPPPQEGMSIDHAVWIAKVEKWLPVLAQARKDVAREEREADATINAKNKSMEAFDELFGVVAAFTSSMLDLIGEDDLAARVKPAARRRGVTAEQDAADQATPATPAPTP